MLDLNNSHTPFPRKPTLSASKTSGIQHAVQIRVGTWFHSLRASACPACQQESPAGKTSADLPGKARESAIGSVDIIVPSKEVEARHVSRFRLARDDCAINGRPCCHG